MLVDVANDIETPFEDSNLIRVLSTRCQWLLTYSLIHSDNAHYIPACFDVSELAFLAAIGSILGLDPNSRSNGGSLTT